MTHLHIGVTIKTSFQRFASPLVKNELYKTASASNIVQTILVTDRGHNDNTVTTVFVVVVFTIEKSTEL